MEEIFLKKSYEQWKIYFKGPLFLINIKDNATSQETTRRCTVEFLSNRFNERVQCVAKSVIDEHFVLEKFAKEWLLLESVL